jgi:hypothetical protein
MKKTLATIFVLCCLAVQSQILTPYQAVQQQPKVQIDYWVYSTHSGNGANNQYPVGVTTRTEMDNLFNTSNSNTTLIQTGKTNSAKILDWTSATELNPIGITLPNSGTYFAFKIQGTFIPQETGTYTFTLEADDASDLIIDGTSVIGTYLGQAVPTLGTHTGPINLIAGKTYSFQVRMQQGGGGYGMRLYWKSPNQNTAPSSYTSVHPASTYFQSWTQNLQEIVTTPSMDGSSAAKAAPSAKYIQTAFNNYTDGVYWINLPYVGPTQVYCLLNTAVNEGGWMMAMKATRGTTFPYSSSYWTAVNTLNPGQTNRNDGDAKFDTMNYYHAKDIMALWPDIAWNYGGSTTGGSVNTSGTYNVWCWLQNNFNNGIRITPINFFNTASKLFFGDGNNFAGRGTPFSTQTDIRFYGFNYTNASSTASVRWGFGWNENGGGLYPNGEATSNDVSGGIGMSGLFATNINYSAGDQLSCCSSNSGINRSARVEIYIR